MVKSSQQKEKLHQLYALYEQPLYRIAYAILHQTEQAEDAVSDAFLKIIPHLDQIESPDSPKTKAFLIQVIRNTAINQYRKNAKDAEPSSVSTASSSSRYGTATPMARLTSSAVNASL